MRLRYIISLCILGAILPQFVTSFDARPRREVPDAPENYKYFLQPFVVPEAERVPQPDLLKAQSVSESTSEKQYKPPLLTLPAPNQPPGGYQSPGGYQPPLPLLQSVPRSPEVPKPSEPLERKPLLYPAAADITELSQSPPERRSDAIDNRSKAVGSSHHPSQAIHKVPASEIQSNKAASAKDRDSAKNDEYVVYYYYYYDNDTNSNNLTLNFDDIPSLDSYDDTKSSKEPEKSASSRSIAANVNSLTPSTEDEPKDSTQRVSPSPSPKPSSPSGASQARSISSGDAAVESVIRADKPDNIVEDTEVQPLKPVSNVFRYGSNEVPRFPVLPNFIVSEVPKEEKTEEQSTPDTLSTPPSTTLPASTASGILNEERLQPEVDSDDANNVLDSDTKVVEEPEEKVTPESSTTTTTTTTTELPTTTEITTTTTEKSRRRPGGVAVGGGGRRRFNSGPAPAARGRQTSTRSTAGATTAASSSTSTTTTTSAPRSFRGGSTNRVRSRPAIGGNRARATLSSSTSTKPEEDTASSSSSSSKAAESTSTTASRSRSTPAPRRFAGGRSSASRSSTTSTTASSRLRTTSRPRPNLITRNRPRPGFLRPRPGKEEEPEPVETTTPEPEVTEEKGSVSPNPEEETEADDTEESETPDTETPEAETEEPTTTEKNRFAALFRPRNRNAGNRPRPVIANRPPRSRR